MLLAARAPLDRIRLAVEVPLRGSRVSSRLRSAHALLHAVREVVPSVYKHSVRARIAPSAILININALRHADVARSCKLAHQALALTVLGLNHLFHFNLPCALLQHLAELTLLHVFPALGLHTGEVLAAELGLARGRDAVVQALNSLVVDVIDLLVQVLSQGRGLCEIGGLVVGVSVWHALSASVLDGVLRNAQAASERVVLLRVDRIRPGVLT